MEGFLITLGNMSVQAAMIICVVLLVRLLFEKMNVPKRITNILWLLPFSRMVLPWKIKSNFTLMPRQAEPFHSSQIRAAVSYVQNAQNKTGNGVHTEISTDAGQAAASAGMDTVLLVTAVLMGIWLTGLLLFFMHGVISYWNLKKKLVCSVCVKENIYFADHIEIPFVFGFFKPGIYLPSAAATQDEKLYYVIAHEKAHIRRKDHLVKLAAYFIAGIHWFNPFAWLAFRYLGKDMEMACDEEAVKQLGDDCRKKYAAALLEFSTEKRSFAGVPLAFSEGNTKKRIVNIMKEKKPLAITVAAAVIVIAVLAAGFATGPKTAGSIAGTEENGITEDTEQQRAEAALEEALGNALEDMKEAEREAEERVEQAKAGVMPVISADMTLGGEREMTSLDYADEEKVIFHDYYGLFVYSIEENMLTGAVNLEAIGCQDTSGENACEVYVTADGSMVFISPAMADYMYVYDLEKKMVGREWKSYADGIELFDGRKETESCVRQDPTVARTRNCVEIEGSKGPYYIYLESGSGMVIDLCCVLEGADVQERFNLFEPEALQ